MSSQRNIRRAHNRVAAKREEPSPVKQLDARFSPTANFGDGSGSGDGGNNNNNNVGDGNLTTDQTSATSTPAAPPTTNADTPVQQTQQTTAAPQTQPTQPTTISTTATTPTPTSATTSQTTANTPPPPSLPLTTAASVPNVVINTQTTIVSNSLTHTLSTTSATHSTTSGASTSSTTSSTGMIAGGVGAGVVILGGLIFALTFFVRRSRKRAQGDDGSSPFNPDTFRRSAVILEDEPGSRINFNRPRAPSMIERKMGASPAPTFSTQYGAGQAPAEYLENGPGYYNQPSFNPGQIFDAASPPPSATSAHGLYDNNTYNNYDNTGYNNYSPSSPAEAYADQSGSPYLSSEPSFGDTTLQRKTSFAAMAAYPIKSIPDVLSRHDSDSSAHGVTPNDYADLTRSSVTPFQAAQYAAISNTLKTDVPQGLDTPAVDAFVGSRMPVLEEQEDVPAVPVKQDASPFSDPMDEFPAPPNAFVAPQSRRRVDSFPPILPEILLPSDESTLEVPASVVTSGMLNTESPLASRFNFPTTPSPMGSQFPITPSPMKSSFSSQDTTPLVAGPPAARTVERTQRPDTIYDDDDAYGGI